MYKQDDDEYFKDATKWFWSNKRTTKDKRGVQKNQEILLEPRLLVEEKTTNEVDEASLKSVVNWDCTGGYRKILKNRTRVTSSTRPHQGRESRQRLLRSFVQLCYDNFL